MTYLFYDYETTGLSPAYDQIVQFAAIRTDENFNVIGEPVDILCKLRDDILPSPYAFLVTKIDIDNLNKNGLNEFDFAIEVNKVLAGNGNQRVIGYNSKEFDDVHSRFLFYRNLLHAYSWTYNNKNSTADLLDIMRLGYAFNKLKDINFKNRDGKDTLKLEFLSMQNNIIHKSAHDALSDVYATIGLLKLVQKSNPKLIEYYHKLFDFKFILGLITENELFYHISAIYGYANKFVSVHTRICPHPQFPKSYITWDLRYNPSQMINKSIEEIEQNRFASKNEKQFDIGFTEIKLNSKPTILEFTKKSVHQSINISDVQTNLQAVKSNMNKLKEIATEIFKVDMPAVDSDADLYIGEYFKDISKEGNKLEITNLSDTISSDVKLKSNRFKEILFRMKARNFYDKLNDDEKEEYQTYKLAKLNNTDTSSKALSFTKFELEYNELYKKSDISDEDKQILDKLNNYVTEKKKLITS